MAKRLEQGRIDLLDVSTQALQHFGEVLARLVKAFRPSWREPHSSDLQTQVLVAQTNDHHRTRLTHTLEVAQISRTISRQLGLNEDLTEAIALGHDPDARPADRILANRILVDLGSKGTLGYYEPRALPYAGDPEVDAARAAVAVWRRFRPTVDLYVAPVLGVPVPPVDCDELDVRIPATAFLRPFNVLGWAALAIGDLQLVAPRDEVVLAAGLAWERAVSSSA